MRDTSPGARTGAPDHLDARLLAECLATSPTWARLGLSVREQRMRERAALAIAEHVLGRLSEADAIDIDQLALAI